MAADKRYSFGIFKSIQNGQAIKTAPQVLACGKGRRHLCGSILLFVFVFVFNAEENIDTILLLTFNKENITWPNGVVNAEEEDHMLGWVDVHHLFRTNIRFTNKKLMPNGVKVSDNKISSYRFSKLFLFYTIYIIPAHLHRPKGEDALLVEEPPGLLLVLLPLHNVQEGGGPLIRDLTKYRFDQKIQIKICCLSTISMLQCLLGFGLLPSVTTTPHDTLTPP